jgi:hypothetical protein
MIPRDVVLAHDQVALTVEVQALYLTNNQILSIASATALAHLMRIIDLNDPLYLHQ